MAPLAIFAMEYGIGYLILSKIDLMSNIIYINIRSQKYFLQVFIKECLIYIPIQIHLMAYYEKHAFKFFFIDDIKTNKMPEIYY